VLLSGDEDFFEIHGQGAEDKRASDLSRHTDCIAWRSIFVGDVIRLFTSKDTHGCEEAVRMIFSESGWRSFLRSVSFWFCS
jgi:hypothetical protein